MVVRALGFPVLYSLRRIPRYIAKENLPKRKTRIAKDILFFLYYALLQTRVCEPILPVES